MKRGPNLWRRRALGASRREHGVESSIAERQSASGSRRAALKAESAIPAICLALSLLNQPLPSPAATITNYLNAYGWLQYALAVNAGDTAQGGQEHKLVPVSYYL
jgi:hypothetical protein